MARPKKTGNELSQIQSDIEAQKEKLKKLQEKERRLQEADNIRLGKLVKSVFKGKLPATSAEQKRMFEVVVKHLDVIYTENKESVVSEQQNVSSVQSQQNTEQVPQQTVTPSVGGTQQTPMNQSGVQ